MGIIEGRMRRIMKEENQVLLTNFFTSHS